MCIMCMFLVLFIWQITSSLVFISYSPEMVIRCYISILLKMVLKIRSYLLADYFICRKFCCQEFKGTNSERALNTLWFCILAIIMRWSWECILKTFYMYFFLSEVILLSCIVSISLLSWGDRFFKFLISQNSCE